VTDQVVLSLFPGVDLFGRGFEAEGFCVVRGPDLIYGSDIRGFSAPAGRFDGVIGGPPCVGYSALRRVPDDGYSDAMVLEFLRVVREARPAWFVMENVPRVPSVGVDGYVVQRFDLSGADCGMRQRRLRHFQFGSLLGAPLAVLRDWPAGDPAPSGVVAAVTASEGRRSGRRGFAEFCQLMGLAGALELPGFSKEASYRAVGNGVPLPMGRVVARSVKAWCDCPAAAGGLCVCGCGRVVAGRARCAGVACRKRLERSRRGVVTVRGRLQLGSCDLAGVTGPGAVTIARSQRDEPALV
jgi:DNA (cytosine-5)-methyltransferase 1